MFTILWGNENVGMDSTTSGRYKNGRPKVFRGTLPFEENQEPRSDEWVEDWSSFGGRCASAGVGGRCKGCRDRREWSLH